MTQDGQLFCWGDLTWALNGGTTLYSGYAQIITIDGSTPLGGVVDVAVGSSAGTQVGPSHVCALVQGASDKEVWCWGNNASGGLGLGDNTTRQYPTKVLGLTAPSKIVISAGITTCVLEGTGVKCWGSNTYGATGIGNTATQQVLSPATVVNSQTGTDALDGVTDLTAASSSSFCALRSDHTLWCWGSGFSPYAKNYGLANVVLAGTARDPRFVTSDGVYHIASNTRTPDCGPL